MDVKGVQWLYAQLPEWVERQIILSEQADALRAHYGPLPVADRNKAMRILLSIVGVALIATGLLLVIAHNWDMLPTGLRLVLAFLPLVGSQGLCIWTILRRYDLVAWRECSAILCMASVGTCMALVSQIFHIQGEMSEYLFWWLVLTLPLVIVMKSTVVAAAAVVLATWSHLDFVSHYHSHFNRYGADTPRLLWYALLLSPSVFHLSLSVRRGNRYESQLLLWILSTCVTIVIVHSTYATHSGAQICLISYFSTLVLAGYLAPGLPPKNALKVIGLMGSFILLLVESLRDTPSSYYSNHDANMMLSAAMIVLALVLYGFGLLKRLPFLALAWSSAFAVLGVIYLVNVRDVATAVISLYLLVLSVMTMSKGVVSQSLLKTNFGLVVLVALIAARFFDTHISYLTRGLLFALAGMLFLGLNTYTMRLRAQRREEVA